MCNKRRKHQQDKGSGSLHGQLHSCTQQHPLPSLLLHTLFEYRPSHTQTPCALAAVAYLAGLARGLATSSHQPHQAQQGVEWGSVCTPQAPGAPDHGPAGAWLAPPLPSSLRPVEEQGKGLGGAGAGATARAGAGWLPRKHQGKRASMLQQQQAGAAAAAAAVAAAAAANRIHKLQVQHQSPKRIMSRITAAASIRGLQQVGGGSGASGRGVSVCVGGIGPVAAAIISIYQGGWGDRGGWRGGWQQVCVYGGDAWVGGWTCWPTA